MQAQNTRLVKVCSSWKYQSPTHRLNIVNRSDSELDPRTWTTAKSEQLSIQMHYNRNSESFRSKHTAGGQNGERSPERIPENKLRLWVGSYTDNSSTTIAK